MTAIEKAIHYTAYAQVISLRKEGRPVHAVLGHELGTAEVSQHRLADIDRGVDPGPVRRKPECGERLELAPDLRLVVVLDKEFRAEE